jgi:four helix bundle protein
MNQPFEENFNEAFRGRTKQLAFDCICLFSQLKQKEELRVIARQLIRSATSVAANFRASCRARSDAEYYSKMCIVVEECDESLFWLEMIEMTRFLKNPKIQVLIAETKQLLIVFARTKKSMKTNKRN